MGASARHATIGGAISRGSSDPSRKLFVRVQRYFKTAALSETRTDGHRSSGARSFGLDPNLLQCVASLLAQSRQIAASALCPLSRVKQTGMPDDAMSAVDPKRTKAGLKSRNAAPLAICSRMVRSRHPRPRLPPKPTAKRPAQSKQKI